jgi:hypothetical protein
VKDQEEIQALKEEWEVKFGLTKPNLKEHSKDLPLELRVKLKSIPLQHQTYSKKNSSSLKMVLSIVAAAILLVLTLSILFQKEASTSLDWSQIDSLSEQELLTNIDSEIVNEFADPLSTDFLLEEDLSESLLEEYLIKTKIPVEYLQ